MFSGRASSELSDSIKVFSLGNLAIKSGISFKFRLFDNSRYSKAFILLRPSEISLKDLLDLTISDFKLTNLSIFFGKVLKLLLDKSMDSKLVSLVINAGRDLRLANSRFRDFSCVKLPISLGNLFNL